MQPVASTKRRTLAQALAFATGTSASGMSDVEELVEALRDAVPRPFKADRAALGPHTLTLTLFQLLSLAQLVGESPVSRRQLIACNGLTAVVRLLERMLDLPFMHNMRTRMLAAGVAVLSNTCVQPDLRLQVGWSGGIQVVVRVLTNVLQHSDAASDARDGGGAGAPRFALDDEVTHDLLSLCSGLLRSVCTDTPDNQIVVGRHGGVVALAHLIKTFSSRRGADRRALLEAGRPMSGAVTAIGIMVHTLTALLAITNNCSENAEAAVAADIAPALVRCVMDTASANIPSPGEYISDEEVDQAAAAEASLILGRCACVLLQHLTHVESNVPRVVEQALRPLLGFVVHAHRAAGATVATARAISLACVAVSRLGSVSDDAREVREGWKSVGAFHESFTVTGCSCARVLVCSCAAAGHIKL